MELASAGVQAGSACGHNHLVEFYETEAFLVETVCAFLIPAFQHGDGAIVVATAAHRREFDAALADAGIDVDAAVREGRYLAFDAAEVLSLFMIDGAPDASSFAEVIGAVMDGAGAGGRKIRVYGEMVAVLWENGDIASALALEDLWNDLAELRTFVLLCAYPMRVFEQEGSAAGFKRICEQHATVIPSEGYSLLGGQAERSRAVAQLQQETASLHAEVLRLRAHEARRRGLAYVDALTGLGNRHAFDLHLERAWGSRQSDEADSFVVVVQIDGFEQLSARCGHAAADQILRQFGEVVRLAASSTDIVARIGADTFAVMLIGCDEIALRRFKLSLHDAVAARAWPSRQRIATSVGHAPLQQSPSPGEALSAAELSMLAQKPFTLAPQS